MTVIKIPPVSYKNFEIIEAEIEFTNQQDFDKYSNDLKRKDNPERYQIIDDFIKEFNDLMI